jgi:hypothetical protein
MSRLISTSVNIYFKEEHEIFDSWERDDIYVRAEGNTIKIRNEIVELSITADIVSDNLDSDSGSEFNPDASDTSDPDDPYNVLPYIKYQYGGYTFSAVYTINSNYPDYIFNKYSFGFSKKYDEYYLISTQFGHDNTDNYIVAKLENNQFIFESIDKKLFRNLNCDDLLYEDGVFKNITDKDIKVRIFINDAHKKYKNIYETNTKNIIMKMYYKNNLVVKNIDIFDREDIPKVVRYLEELNYPRTAEDYKEGWGFKTYEDYKVDKYLINYDTAMDICDKLDVNLNKSIIKFERPVDPIEDKSVVMIVKDYYISDADFTEAKRDVSIYSGIEVLNIIINNSRRFMFTKKSNAR